MITNIKIKNFKVLKNIDIDVKNLNIFTGLNDMGKSTILQTLILLRQSAKNRFEKLILNDIIDLGRFKDIFCESANETKVLSFELHWNDNTKILVERNYEKQLSEEKSIKGNALEVNFQNQSLFGDNTFMYLSAHRIKPQDTYDINSSMMKNGQFGNEGEFAPHYYHLNKNEDIPIKELAFDSEETVFSLEQQVNRWLSVISPKIRVHTESRDGRLIQLTYSYETKTANTSNFSPKNAGFGLTYVFSVLVAILSAKKGDIIILENPESHIHPKGQSELARLMTLAAKNGVQIFCETHSEHIIYGTRIAIKEREIAKEQVRIYYIDRDENEHFSHTHNIEIDDFGRIEREARGYFDEFESHLNRLM